MYKDEKRKEVWLLSKGENHIMPKGTIMGGYGGGAMSARKADSLDCVPSRLLMETKSRCRSLQERRGRTRPSLKLEHSTP